MRAAMRLGIVMAMVPSSTFEELGFDIGHRGLGSLLSHLVGKVVGVVVDSATDSDRHGPSRMAGKISD
jgi:hypothetical protein